jgi:hypothetical protein
MTPNPRARPRGGINLTVTAASIAANPDHEPQRTRTQDPHRRFERLDS